MPEREFQFLPDLPKANLDDRTFQELVNECLLRIPRYCPEWTNYNPSDPGVTLIELFAWLTDQMLFRFNNVPRRHYVAFLELLGIRLNPPTPATTEVTFYLSTSSDQIPENNRTIPTDTEVATERAENQEPIIFTTDYPLIIGDPHITHIFKSETIENSPQSLSDNYLSGSAWRLEGSEWRSSSELSIFYQNPQPGNCFYLVLNPQDNIDGNVIAINFKGEAGTPTGIDPRNPPIRWEAWNGSSWEEVLMKKSNDYTEGFSFSKLQREKGSPLEDGADVELHLPLNFPPETFVNYRGRWLRCVYFKREENQPLYRQSPRIVRMSVRSLGGTIPVTQAYPINDEILGESNGEPGQVFYLQRPPVLPRNVVKREYIEVITSGGMVQKWTEVTDFAESKETDLHYTLDSQSGRVQFGPLIREPGHLKEISDFRARLQSLPNQMISSEVALNDNRWSTDTRQCGAIPPRGSTIRMVSYRTGGGSQGNVQPGSITILKSAVPYVAQITNYKQGRNGAEAQSLDYAVLQVPKMLRTQNRAVTTEDFETLAKEGGQGAIARVKCCPPSDKPEEAGRIKLLLIPQVSLQNLENGIPPEAFEVDQVLIKRVSAYLDERKLLGINIKYEQPEYMGVSVQTEVSLEDEYKNPRMQQEIKQKLELTLYQFLNPITGGEDGTGWVFGRPVYTSDIVKHFQKVKGVRYVGSIQLFAILNDNDKWERYATPLAIVRPSSLGLICSWKSDRQGSSHLINFI
jgi:predicted phage baseplate assembly protein